MTMKLESAPFPGALGEEILAKVSLDTWEDWRQMQTKIINEYRLDLSESNDRQTLLKQMRSFLKLDGHSDAVLEVGTPV
ncbi:MAG: Fe(2+)-trafficking protein [Myxococcaceae bacterium]